ncbi:MAG TPA: SBBP repeat-containing protein [Ignavibacteria bacterium]|nr:SBBP repeat-containing protein [Ignavibacteria bacterium]
MKNKRLHILIIFLLSFFQFYISYSQEWIRTFGSNGDDKVLDVVTDFQGNVYLTGYTTLTGSGKDFRTTKVSPSGQEIWTRTYNGPGNDDDRAFGIAIDRQGLNVYVTGYSTYQGINTDITTIKYSASGTQLNVNRIGDPSNLEDRAFGIAVDRTNNVYVTGYITRPGIGRDIYTAKFNSNLVFVWHKTYVGNGNGEDRAFGIVTDSLGLNIFITGFTTDSANGSDMITISYDSSGTERWVDIFNGESNEEDRAFGIAVDIFQAGNVYITGYSANDTLGPDYTTIKYNSANGSRIWVSKYNGSGNSSDRAFGIVVDRTGNSYITGMSAGAGTGGDYLTIKYNSSGDSVWTQRYHGDGNNTDSAAALLLSKSEEVLYVTGMSINDTAAGKEDVFTIKYNALSGDSLQASRINMPPGKTDVGVNVVSDTTGNIFIAGYTFSLTNDFDWLVIKYHLGELVIGIQQISSEVPAGFALYQNYPNPFNPVTSFRFQVPVLEKKSAVIIKIYDILGREIAELINDYLSSGTYEAVWNASAFASGVYFYSLISEGYIQTNKMILLK